LNACLDLRRRSKRRPIEVDLDVADPGSTEDVAARVVDRALLDRALRSLDVDARSVLVLHYYLGMPIAEVASTLGIPAGTAKSRLHRSLEAMRAQLGDRGQPTAATVAEGQPA
jgi:RNA polymerase sigma-70 factor, ECF subfamily